MINDLQKPLLSRRGFTKLGGLTALSAIASVDSSDLTYLEPTKILDADYVQSDQNIRSVCSPNCTGSCAIDARIKDGVMVGVQPGQFPDTRFNRMCLKGVSNAMQRVYSDNRVKYPMKRAGERGEGKWERISWDEALDYIASKHKEISEKYGPEANSWISMTGNYGAMVQTIGTRTANSVGGTAFTNFGIMGDNASNMGMLLPTGVQQEGHSWDDLKGAKLGLFFGCNYCETTVNDSHFVMDAIENGMKLIVIDPRFSRTAAKAHKWIPIRPGTDAALLLGISNYVIENEKYDSRYLKLYTDAPLLVRNDTGELLTSSEVGLGADGFVGWDSSAEAPVYLEVNATQPYPLHIEYDVTDPEVYVPLRGEELALKGSFNVVVDGKSISCTTVWSLLVEHLKQYDINSVSSICEVPEQDIIELAELYINTNPAAIRMSQGVQRYWQGHQPFRAGMVLAGICGNIGKKHSGFTWSDGSLMRLLFSVPGEWMAPVPNVSGKSAPGTRFIDHIINADPYPIKSLWVVAYGLGTQTPERSRLFGEAFNQLDLVVVSEIVMTPAAEMADIVLPVTSYFEESGDVIGSWSNRYIQVRKQAIEPLWESRTDFQIFKDYAERMGVGQYWDMTDIEAGRLILEKSPSKVFNSVNFDKLYTDGVTEINMPEEYYPFADLRFPTKTGRFTFYNPEYSEFREALPVFTEPLESNRNKLAEKFPFVFMNVRSVYSAHSQHYPLKWIREVNPEPLVQINPKDAELKQLKDRDKVRIFNERGSFETKIIITEGIKPGCINLCQGWWPEDFNGTHYGDLLHMELNPIQDAISETNFSPYDNLVDIEKA